MVRGFLLFIVAIATAISSIELSASDTLSCRQLTDMVGQSQSVNWDKALALRTEAGSHPQLKCVAQQSMALLMIRSNRFSDAWKQLAEIDALVDEAVPGIRFEQIKLKLWLFAEARSPRADEQLKTLVTMILRSDTKESDRQDASRFLGKLLKILDGCEGTCGVSKATIDRAKQVLQTQGSKLAVAAFEDGWQASQAWEQTMRSLLERCTDKAASQSVAEELLRDLDTLRKQNTAIEVKLSEEKKKENELDLQRLAAVQHQKEVMLEMRRPTPGMPMPPTRKSVSPLGSKPTRAEEKQHDKDLDRAYEEFEKDKREYPAKLLAWQEKDRVRREQLAKTKAAADDQLSSALNSVRAQEEVVKALNIESDSSHDAIDKLTLQHAGAHALATRTEVSMPKSDFLQKPAYYPVIDYPQEALRLSKLVSKSSSSNKPANQNSAERKK